jgi:hypothetical protein
MGAGEFRVGGGRLVEQALLIFGQTALALGRDARYQRARIYDLALPDDGPRRHHRAPADRSAAQNQGADADQAMVFDVAAVDDGLVADGDSGTDPGGVAAVGVHGAVVLDVGAGSD